MQFFENFPYGLFPMQVTVATATFFFTLEFPQVLRAGSGAGQRAAQHSRVGTKGQRDLGHSKGQARQQGPCFSSLQAVAGAEGQRDLLR